MAEPAVTTRGNAPGDRPGHRGVAIPPAPPPPFLPERVAQILSGARDLPERDTPRPRPAFACRVKNSPVSEVSGVTFLLETEY